MLSEFESPLSETEAATLAELGRLLLNCGFGMLLRSYRETHRRTGTLEFDRTFFVPGIVDLIDLFCLCKPMSEETVAAAVGNAAASLLVKHKVLSREEGMLRMNGLRLIDHFGVFLFVGDEASSKGLYFGEDSTALGSWLLGTARGRCLDICCGVGTQTILMARQGTEAVGVERNPDALLVAHIHAALNGVAGKVRFFQGDVLESFAEGNTSSLQALGQFDAVCCNPPLLPVPPQAWLPVVADGGPDGLSFTVCILSALPALLAPEGRCYIIGTILGPDEQPDIGRLEEVLNIHALRAYMVVPSIQDIRRGQPFRKLLEATSIREEDGKRHPDLEALSEAWEGLTAHGTHLYSFCLVASHVMQDKNAGLEFTRHYRRNDNFWYV
jgi:methylase of polypeptide subunit release factors